LATVRDIFSKAIAIIDELSDTGAVSDTQVKEYKARAPYLLDLWQKEIVTSGDFYKTFEVSCYRKKNLLGDLNNYGNIIENNGEIHEYSAIGANCFFIDVDGDCIISFKENGNPISGKYTFNGGPETEFVGSININLPAGTTSFLPVKGILNVLNQTSTVTMTINGQYYFRHNNRALAPYKYNSALRVPDFRPWYKIQMPDDFKSRHQIIDEYKQWQYVESNQHKWEGNNELYIHFDYEGIVRIKYVPVPTPITSLDQEINVDDITAISGAYYLAEHFALADQNNDLAVMCRNKFKELKTESMFKTPLSPSEIKDVYNLGSVRM